MLEQALLCMADVSHCNAFAITLLLCCLVYILQPCCAARLSTSRNSLHINSTADIDMMSGHSKLQSTALHLPGRHAPCTSPHSAGDSDSAPRYVANTTPAKPKSHVAVQLLSWLVTDPSRQPLSQMACFGRLLGGPRQPEGVDSQAHEAVAQHWQQWQQQQRHAE